MSLPYASTPSAGTRLLDVASTRLFRRQVTALLKNPGDCAMLWMSLDLAGRQSLTNRMGKLRGGSDLVTELHAQLGKANSLYLPGTNQRGPLPPDRVGRYQAWLADPSGFVAMLHSLPASQAAVIANEVHEQQAAVLARALPRGLATDAVSPSGARAMGVAALAITGCAAGAITLGSASSLVVLGGVVVVGGELLLKYTKLRIPENLRPFRLAGMLAKMTAQGVLEAGKVTVHSASRAVARRRLSNRGIG